MARHQRARGYRGPHGSTRCPTPPKLRTLRLPDLTPDDPSVLRAPSIYEVLFFSGDGLTGMYLTNASSTDCSLAALNVH